MAQKIFWEVDQTCTINKKIHRCWETLFWCIWTCQFLTRIKFPSSDKGRNPKEQWNLLPPFCIPSWVWADKDINESASARGHTTHICFQALAKGIWTPVWKNKSFIHRKYFRGHSILFYKCTLSDLRCFSVLQKFCLHLRGFLKSNPKHMEGAVGSIYLSHHVRHHQPVQSLAGESEQDLGNVGSQKESLDSPVCFLQWRTSVCKPPKYQEKMQDFCLLIFSMIFELFCMYTHTYL